jgi:hypothetical protein
MTSQPFGRGLLTWCERHLAPEFVDAVVQPLVADAQREELAARSHSRLVYWLVVLRSYLAFVHALVVGGLMMRRIMKRTGSNWGWSRLVLAPLAAIGAVIAAGFAVQAVHYLLVRSFGLSSPTLGLVTNAADYFVKSAAMVVVAWIVAPLRLKRRAAVVAFAFALLLNGLFMVVTVRQAPAAWTRWIGLGTVGLLGAVLSLRFTWRRHPIATHADR